MKNNESKIKLEASDLFKKIIKQKTLNSGTVVLCYISTNLCGVLVYNTLGRLVTSRCLDVGYTKHIRAKALKNLNKTYNEFKNILSTRNEVL